MDPVAYNGITSTNQGSVAVTDMSNLNTILASTVQSYVTGTITNGSGGTGGFGGDGGYMSELTYGGSSFSFNGSTVTRTGGSTAYTFDSTTHVLTLTTSAGSFVINMDTGIYTYNTSNANTTVAQEVFGYTLRDADGDTSSGSLAINLDHYNYAPIAADDQVTIVSTSGTTSVTIKDLWLTWNDSDSEGSPLSITSVSNATSHASGQVVDAVATGTTGTGSFSYEVSDGSLTNDATVSITKQTSTTLTGNGLNNILVGGSAADTINGNEGNDVLVGNAGNDTLNGGSGNDLLIGGLGNDTLTGGAGSDVFRWELADKGTAGLAATTANDRVTDFSTSTSGEYLDLRDLLQGHGATLTNYIDITTSGSDTILRVSTSGGFTNGTYASGSEDQRITLTGVNLYTAYGVTAGDDATLIQNLISQGKLKVD